MCLFVNITCRHMWEKMLTDICSVRTQSLCPRVRLDVVTTQADFNSWSPWLLKWCTTLLPCLDLHFAKIDRSGQRGYLCLKSVLTKKPKTWTKIRLHVLSFESMLNRRELRGYSSQEDYLVVSQHGQVIRTLLNGTGVSETVEKWRRLTTLPFEYPIPPKNSLLNCQVIHP